MTTSITYYNAVVMYILYSNIKRKNKNNALNDLFTTIIVSVILKCKKSCADVQTCGVPYNKNMSEAHGEDLLCLSKSMLQNKEVILNLYNTNGGAHKFWHQSLGAEIGQLA